MGILKSIVSFPYDHLDRVFKFSSVLKKGEIGIQVGVDMGSTTTSDLLHISKIVGDKGLAIGIDPDANNIKLMGEIVAANNFQVKLVNKATYKEAKTLHMQVGTRPGNNQTDDRYEKDYDGFVGSTIEVQADTVDNILAELKIPYEKVSHISITNNGAEYDTLLGMTKLMEASPNLSINTLGGRKGVVGIINGRSDIEVIIELLEKFGFRVVSKKINNFFWNGFVKFILIRGIFKGKWNINREYMTWIFARKGNKKFGFLELL